jgi:hypothetical protein
MFLALKLAAKALRTNIILRTNITAPRVLRKSLLLFYDQPSVFEFLQNICTFKREGSDSDRLDFLIS